MAATATAQGSAALASGRELFEANCASCHGVKAKGTDLGPPLVHRIYEPSHHADMAFQLAARNSVREHHWNFGNMPPVEGVSHDEVAEIIAYVRALLEDAGIF